jgi:hypothetical protein
MHCSFKWRLRMTTIESFYAARISRNTVDRLTDSSASRRRLGASRSVLLLP